MPEVHRTDLVILLHKRNFRFGRPYKIVEFAVVVSFNWQMFDFELVYDLAVVFLLFRLMYLLEISSQQIDADLFVTVNQRTMVNEDKHQKQAPRLQNFFRAQLN